MMASAGRFSPAAWSSCTSLPTSAAPSDALGSDRTPDIILAERGAKRSVKRSKFLIVSAQAAIDCFPNSMDYLDRMYKR